MPVRAVLAVLAATVALALVPVTPAAAAGKNSTKIVVSLKFPAFHGSLKSPRQACLGSRKMKLYRERSGPDRLLGSDKSRDNGKWSIPIGKRLISGSYYATAAKRGKCKAAKSKALAID